MEANKKYRYILQLWNRRWNYICRK